MIESNSYQGVEDNKLLAVTDNFEDEGTIRPKSSMFVFISLLVVVYFAFVQTGVDTSGLSTGTDKKLSSRSSFRSDTKYVRKEIRDMTDTELSNYFSAVWTMKKTGRQDDRDYLLKYDDFVAQHMIATANSTIDQAHEYAAFLSWHSLLVMEFEIALQSIDSTVTIPYWNWTIDQQLEDPSLSEIFSSTYFGTSNTSNQYIVDTGPMAYFPVSSSPLDYVSWESPYGYLRGADNYNDSPYVSRMLGVTGQLASTAQVNACLSMLNYSSFWICIWGTYASEANSSDIHAGVHYFVGGEYYNAAGEAWYGDMLDFYSSPNDPIWWSHHAMIDKIWFEWKDTIGSSLTSDEDECGGFYEGEVVDPQPVGHNLYEKFDPAFYAFRTVEEIETEGGLTLNEACYYFANDLLPYTYDS